VKEWRKIVGESWNIGALGSQERWNTFVKENESLIYQAMLNFEDSRKKLTVILDSM
jgi:hypothetical protein